ncbi:MAG: nuclear transport factor 2 family protein [Streptosporangiaceae bacterium]
MSNVQLMRDLYEALHRGDVAWVLGVMDLDIEWREAEGNPYQPDGQAWHGPDAVVKNLFMRLASEWDGFTVHPWTFHEAGDAVVVEARYTGTFRATGRKLDAQVCHVWRIRDGKVRSFQQYADTAQLQDVGRPPLSAADQPGLAASGEEEAAAGAQGGDDIGRSPVR